MGLCFRNAGRTICVIVALAAGFSVATSFVSNDVAYAKSDKDKSKKNKHRKSLYEILTGKKLNQKKVAKVAPKRKVVKKRAVTAVRTSLVPRPRNATVALAAVTATYGAHSVLEDAEPDTQLGRIAAYRAAVLEQRRREAYVLAAQTELDALPAALRPQEAIAKSVELTEQSLADTAAQIAQAETTLAQSPTDAAAIQALADLHRQNQAQMMTKELLTTEAENAESFAQARSVLTEAEISLAQQKQVAEVLLRAATNKPITPAVVAQVNSLLGVEEFPMPVAAVDRSPIVVAVE